VIDFESKLGARAQQRLQQEFTIWLTTSGANGAPHPRPVWFIWDGEAVLIYSQPNQAKLKHIASNPRVALHFDGGPKALDVQVFAATATILGNPTPAHQVPAYVAKYGAEIEHMGATAEAFAQAYSVTSRVVLERVRGMTAQAGT
jgi:PPOX class probable F420-dependent enzyme